MGRLLLISRLAVRDLRRRRTEAALLLVAIMAATTTLTLGLVLRDAADDPYQTTREATRGPDVIAAGKLDTLHRLPTDNGVTTHSGPFPVVSAELQTPNSTSGVQVVGRDTAATDVDQPEVRDGGWVRDGGVVVEAAYASEAGIRVGDRVTIGGRAFEVVGTAVTAALAPYPATTCLMACLHGDPNADGAPEGVLANPGLVWLTQGDVRNLGVEVSTYVVNLRLADPNQATAFVEAHGADGPMLRSWQEIRTEATELAQDIQILLLIGAWLLGLLAVASLSVLVGGRMADQTRRVGLLKAVGGTPGLVAGVLLAEYVLVSLVAAAAGLVIGAVVAPLLIGPGAGLLGTAGTPSLTLSTVVVVTVSALGVASLATVVPAVKAARASTVDALADAARPPRRTGWAIRLSARLPVPLLLAVRVAARRPRRVVLGMVSVAITVSGVFVALVLDAFLRGQPLVIGYDAAQVGQLRRVLFVVMGIVACLAAINAIVLTWATVLDNRHTSALARALGATPRAVSAALAAAQVLPALAGAILGVPGGLAFFALIMAATGGDSDRASWPSPWQTLALVLATGLVAAVLTAIPARLASRRPVANSLRAEPA
ncbi:FtsX-like permease family protein [Cryptosporangium sp. NPDC048952]|uniref:ABC transporter permease n=1 Tax=Cryptosporangium sp. NPDC048952 TaxID=3363961 RepID=UPI0037150736